MVSFGDSRSRRGSISLNHDSGTVIRGIAVAFFLLLQFRVNWLRRWCMPASVFPRGLFLEQFSAPPCILRSSPYRIRLKGRQISVYCLACSSLRLRNPHLCRSFILRYSCLSLLLYVSRLTSSPSKLKKKVSMSPFAWIMVVQQQNTFSSQSTLQLTIQA